MKTKTLTATAVALLAAITLTACTSTHDQPGAVQPTKAPTATQSASPAGQPTEAATTQPEATSTDVRSIAQEYAEYTGDPYILTADQADAAAAVAPFLTPELEREAATGDPGQVYFWLPFAANDAFDGSKVDPARQQPVTIDSVTQVDATADGAVTIEVVLHGVWAYDQPVKVTRTLDMEMVPGSSEDDRAWVIRAITGNDTYEAA